ncbi:prepilin peptidase [Sphingosinicella soli]|uniref:Prepilin leader peptidase/N-methyltransferase n=1 Tax=Sphingosinicella soli TaxID=333708 RepID=A0A7W7B0S7_9SPHN|nr:A24 family peptidase [Sphingosinicella soli]MBB4631930.1 leader peptidase (prepilin peptidase)/N-methyltransferase [Sphingosinicella soli]
MTDLRHGRSRKGQGGAVLPGSGIAGGLILACGFLAGTIAGSFMALVAARLPLRRTIVGGRSQCDTCGRILGPLELVPIASFLALRGRCRGCSAAIPASTWVMELLAGIVGLLAVLLARTPADLVWAVFGWLLLLLAALDLRHYWLPQRLTALLAFTGIVALFITRGDVAASLAGGAAGFLGLEAVRIGYRLLRGREGIGGGDPLLLGGIGVWMGWQALPFVLIVGSLAGFGLIVIWKLRGADVGPATRLPLGACLAIAAIAVWAAAARAPIVPLALL